MKTNQIFQIGLAILLVALDLQLVNAAPATARFGTKWNSLLGEWKGEGTAGGGGVCGFHLELSNQIITRTNHANLAVAGKPAAAHDDFMVIYPGVSGDKAKAMYFDNEGHVIDYDAEWSADGNSLVFTSKPGAGPQFRLSYKKAGPKSFLVTFEMAPPGQGAFKVYNSGTIVKAE